MFRLKSNLFSLCQMLTVFEVICALLSGESRVPILPEGAEAVVPRTDDEKVSGRPWHPIKPTTTQEEEIMKVMPAHLAKTLAKNSTPYTTSLIIRLPKKGNFPSMPKLQNDCQISHPSKAMLRNKILIKEKAEELLSEEHATFGPARGTTSSQTTSTDRKNWERILHARWNEETRKPGTTIMARKWTQRRATTTMWKSRSRSMKYFGAIILAGTSSYGEIWVMIWLATPGVARLKPIIYGKTNNNSPATNIKLCKSPCADHTD